MSATLSDIDAAIASLSGPMHWDQAGEIVKQTAWPWQTNGKPCSRTRQRQQRDTQPNQLVIGLAESEMTTANLHRAGSVMVTQSNGRGK